MGKGKIKKVLKEEKPIMYLKMISYTKPQFAHNAGAAGKIPVWTYAFWRATDKTNVGSFEIEMDLTKAKNMKEQAQSTYMNDSAIKFLEKQYPNDTVKLTSV
ncbi:MAG: hypothetical protein ABI832_09620 [bacterium]